LSTVIELTVKVDVPLFSIVMACAALADPTDSVPKLRDAGEAATSQKTAAGRASNANANMVKTILYRWNPQYCFNIAPQEDCYLLRETDWTHASPCQMERVLPAAKETTPV
jgi:hypothetical protein